MTKILIQLRLFDEDKTLSLTSILLMVMIARLAIFPADIYSLGLLTLALAHANAKRFSRFKGKVQADKVDAISTEAKTRVEALESEVKKLATTLNLKNLGR